MNESENLWNADSLLKLSEDLQAENEQYRLLLEQKGESDTDAFIRCAKAEIADTLHAIDDSRTRARDSEAERSYRQISRERLGIGRESATDRGESEVTGREREVTKHLQRSRDKDRGR